MRKLPIALAVAASALIAVFSAPGALAQSPRADGLHLGSKNQPVRIDGPLYIDSTKAGVFDGGNAIVFSGIGHLDYDFASLTATAGAMNTVCAESSAVTATGCRFGDQVLLGVDQALVNSFGVIDAYVSAADQVKVRACAVGITDGGSFNQPDSGYTVRCIR